MLTMNQASSVSETPGGLEIVAPRKTDFFVDPASGLAKANAPFCYEKATGDFVARVTVKPSFKKRYDAGGLFVYAGPRKWIKHEFEMTDLGYPSVVSVVTNGASDDANGERMDGRAEVRLQIARRGDLWVLHYLNDENKWTMTRYFRLKMKAELKVGLEAQSPVGAGCRVLFERFELLSGALKDMRKGC
jgi:regulation of enolase protein 1 (concanavalin A-like superfamily)